MKKYLAGDIGGTKTLLAVIEVSGTQVQVVHEVGYQSSDYATFELLLGDFLADAKSSLSPNSDDTASHSTKPASGQVAGYLPRAPSPQSSPASGRGGEREYPCSTSSGERDADSLRENSYHAAFGIAGPVQGRVAQTTNLPWRIDADVLQQQFGIAHCTLLNDLEATAYGLPALGSNDLLTLQTGAQDAGGNVAVIAAGTGLGEAGLYWDGQRHQPFATEGGHASFSPGDELEIAFLRYLQQQHRHVSWERVVSGMGLVSLHEFLRLYRHRAAPLWLAEELQGVDPAASISAAALSGRDEICVETLARFVRLYGAEAGNLALKVMSRGGLYLGGGIAPKILPLLQNGTFLDAFLNKGRMRPLLEAMPVKVILNDRAALFGSALRAAQLANKPT